MKEKEKKSVESDFFQTNCLRLQKIFNKILGKENYKQNAIYKV